LAIVPGQSLQILQIAIGVCHINNGAISANELEQEKRYIRKRAAPQTANLSPNSP